MIFWKKPVRECSREEILNPSLLVLSRTFGMWVGRWSSNDKSVCSKVSLMWPNSEPVRTIIMPHIGLHGASGVWQFITVDEGPHNHEEYTQMKLVELLMSGGPLTDSTGKTLVELPSFSSANELRMKLELNGMFQMGIER